MVHRLVAFVLLVLSLALPARAQCTVALAPLGLEFACAQEPYTEAAPLAAVRVRFDATLVELLRCENRTPFAPGTVTFSVRRIRVELARSPGFEPAAGIGALELPLRDRTFGLLPFDGVEDWGGASGRTSLNGQFRTGEIEAATLGPDAPFRVPWTLYGRIRATGAIHGTGAFSAMDDYLVGGVVSLDYVPASTP